MTTCSLIIPVYEHSSYLAKCIDSALNQVVPFDEIIIIDDCSPDPTVQKILTKYDGIERVHLHRNETNMGIAITQNLAVALCKSEYVAFLDCDDILGAHAREAFDGYHGVKDADYFFSNRYEIGPTDELLKRVDVGPQINEYDKLTQCLLEHMVASHFKVIRKASLDDIGGFPTHSDGVQDWVVAVNIITDDNAVHIAEYVYSHRIHPGQTTAQDNTRYVAVVNAERERRLGVLGHKNIKSRKMVSTLAPFFSRVEILPKGTFLLSDGHMRPWVPSWLVADEISEGTLLFYMPGRHHRVAQNFYACHEKGVETVMVVDRRSPNSIALTRWASAFFDHIICLDPVARLAIEPWVADKSKIVLGYSKDVLKRPNRDELPRDATFGTAVEFAKDI